MWISLTKNPQFLTCSQGKQWLPPSSGGLWYIYKPSNPTRCLFVAQGDAHGEQGRQHHPPICSSVFLDNTRIWIIKVWSKWENVNETKDRHTLALIWWTRNAERGKLPQDHVHADTWETDEVEAIVLIWMQILSGGAEDGERKHIRIGDPQLCLLPVEELDQTGDPRGWAVCCVHVSTHFDTDHK